MEISKKNHKWRSTIADVAMAAGVSRTTVSFVLNNTPGKSISQATRQRVRKAAQDLGYRPNVYAQALGRGHTNEIAHIFFEPVHTFLGDRWIEPVQNRTRELGYTAGTYMYRGTSHQSIRGIIEDVLSRSPAGVITSSMYFTVDDWKRAQEMGVRACVFLDIEAADYATTVVTPISKVGQLIGKYFLERGDRHIASVVPILPDQTNNNAWQSYTQGLQSVLEKGDIKLSIFPMAPTLDSARATVNQLLSSRTRPTAIIGFTATYALMLLRTLLEAKVRVPEDIAVASIEDTFVCNLVHPSLTSVSYDLGKVGTQQVDIADALIRGEEPNPELFVCPSPELIVRESTK